MEDGILAGGSPRADKVTGEALFVETVVGLPLPVRGSNLVIAGLRRLRGLDKLVLNSCVKPMKWDHLSADMSVPGTDAAQSIINL